jgi:hypothetical protein
VQADLEASLGYLIVREIGRRDGDDLDAVLPLSLLCDERLVVRVEAAFVQAKLDAKVLAALSIEVEGAADHRVGGVIAKGTGTVLVAHLASAAAADHSPSERTIEQSFTIQHLLCLPI